MEKVLVTGGSHAELPLIESAKELGYYVITTGNNEDGLGHRSADKYVKGDFSDKEFVYQLAKKEKVSAIISGCNDFAYLSTAYACERLGLAGHDNYEKAKVIHHKNLFKELLSELGIRTPRISKCYKLDEIENCVEQIGFPLVVKPVDLTGGKGVQVCNNKQEVLDAYGNAMRMSRQDFVLMEEYIKGSNHGASVLLKGQKVVFGFIDDEQYYKNPYLVSGACFPSSVSENAINKLYKDIELIATNLELGDGLFHVQFILENEENPVMIDPCRRAPGDLYILLVKYATGIDYPMQIVKAECGKKIKDYYEVFYRNIARQCVMTSKNGIYRDIYYDASIEPDIFDKMIWAQTGDVIDDYEKYKAGIVFFECKDNIVLYEKVKQFHEKVYINVQ